MNDFRINNSRQQLVQMKLDRSKVQTAAPPEKSYKNPIVEEAKDMRRSIEKSLNKIDIKV